MKRLFSIFTLLWLAVGMLLQAQTAKAPVFLYAGQSNADGREYVQVYLPEYMKVGDSSIRSLCAFKICQYMWCTFDKDFR